MSADNGIYILEAKDGYRVIHAQCIENLYWWPDTRPGARAYDFVKKTEINPIFLKEYFGKAKVITSRTKALLKAVDMMNKLEICEYGIKFILGWENKPFPTKRKK